MTASVKYFGDIGVSLEDISCLIVLHIVQCKSLEEITKDGFVKGWSASGYDVHDDCTQSEV